MKTAIKTILFIIFFAWMTINIVLIFGEAEQIILFPCSTNLLGVLSTFIEAEVFGRAAAKGLTFDTLEED